MFLKYRSIIRKKGRRQCPQRRWEEKGRGRSSTPHNL